MTRNAPLLSCEKLAIGYGGKTLLPPLSLDIHRGELVVVVGGNGAGKSTWVKTVLGLVPPIDGRVHTSSPAPKMAYIPQVSELDELLPIRVREVVGWGRICGAGFLWPLARAADRKRRDRALEDAGCAHLAKKRVRDLSGGQRQRVLIARVLASDADLAILDEPTAALDLAGERDTYLQLAEVARTRNIGVVAVSHALSAATRHASRVIFFDPGSVEREGAVHVGEPAAVLASAAFRAQFGEVS